MRRICVLCVLAIVSMLASACAVAPQTPIYYTTTLNKAQSVQMLRPGRNTIIVNGFTHNPNNGRIITCAGADAEIIPFTETAAEFMKFIFGSAEGGQRTNDEFYDTMGRIANADPSFRAKYAMCSSDGFATFRNVADGEFALIVRAGGEVYGRKVSVRGYETKNVVVSGSSRKLPSSFNYDRWERHERHREREARRWRRNR